MPHTGAQRRSRVYRLRPSRGLCAPARAGQARLCRAPTQLSKLGEILGNQTFAGCLPEPRPSSDTPRARLDVLF
jgi:hypothetical protein